MSSAYDDLKVFYGDMHNHCGISYGHGSLADALANAREQLDFVSITGHAHWPDMPEPEERIQYIIDFHEEGFARLKKTWPEMMETLREANEEGEFIVFPGFEVHSCESGDRNMLYKDLNGEIIYPDSIEDLHAQLSRLRDTGKDSIAQPHHVGYRKGTRGIDWSTFNPTFAPFVEMLSMHGCSEDSECPRPFLHSMGPSDWESTIAYGLEQGHIFGFSGGTDHHSGHPGSYGHSRTGLWAKSCSREDIWEALYARRMYALTGDRIDLQFSINNSPMGSVISPAKYRNLNIAIKAGGAIDCVDVIKNGNLYQRFSQLDVTPTEKEKSIRTKIYLELGWGPKRREHKWNAELGITDGKIISVEPRFRGLEVVSPAERDAGESESFYRSKVHETDVRSVTFETVSSGNPTNSTPATQGMCIEVEMPRSASVYAKLDGIHTEHSLESLLRGARSGSIDHTDAPFWKFHRVPEPQELNWNFNITDSTPMESGFYYIRVRQKNDQWAWSSPIFIR